MSVLADPIRPATPRLECALSALCSCVALHGPHKEGQPEAPREGRGSGCYLVPEKGERRPLCVAALDANRTSALRVTEVVEICSFRLQLAWLVLAHSPGNQSSRSRKRTSLLALSGRLTHYVPTTNSGPLFGNGDDRATSPSPSTAGSGSPLHHSDDSASAGNRVHHYPAR